MQQLSPSVLAEIVDRAIRNVKERRVFAENLRNELSNYSYQQLQEDSNEFSAVKAIYEGYTRNGDAEKFYAKYYSTVAAKSIQFFSGISRNAATLLATKVADCLLSPLLTMVEGSAGAVVAASQIKAVELDFFSTSNCFSSCFLHAPVSDPFYERYNPFSNMDSLSETDVIQTESPRILW